MFKLEINSIDRQLDMESDSPLLYAIRDGVKITGTRPCRGIGGSALPQLTAAVVNEVLHSPANYLARNLFGFKSNGSQY